jgi:hypothetical protein
MVGGNEGKIVLEKESADNVFLLQIRINTNFRLPAKDNNVSSCHREAFS